MLGKMIGKSIIAGVGLLLSLFALLISFVPPESIVQSETRTYQMILLISFAVTVILPFVIYELHDKRVIDFLKNQFTSKQEK